MIILSKCVYLCRNNAELAQLVEQLIRPMINKEDWGKAKSENGKVKAAGKREQRKSSLLLCRAGAGSSARSAVKAENGMPGLKPKVILVLYL